VKIGPLWRPVGEVKKRKKKEKKKVTNSDISHMRRDPPRSPIAPVFGS